MVLLSFYPPIVWKYSDDDCPLQWPLGSCLAVWNVVPDVDPVLGCCMEVSTQSAESFVLSVVFVEGLDTVIWLLNVSDICGGEW